MRPVRRRLVLLPVLIAGAGAWAQGPSVEQCVAASESGQVLQKEGWLLAARTQLERCADPQCPQPVRTDCNAWLGEVLAAMPSVIIVARSADGDRRDARVTLDGKPWLTELTGRPVELDPGEHELVVFTDHGTVGQKLVVNTGEKNRLVVFALDAVAPAAPVATAEAPAGARPFPAAPVAVTGVALVGLGLFAGLGLGGRAQLDALTRSPCAATRSCDPRKVDEVRRLFAAADISLGVGALSAAAAVVLWWRWAAAPPPVEPSVALSPAGAVVGLRGTF